MRSLLRFGMLRCAGCGTLNSDFNNECVTCYEPTRTTQHRSTINRMKRTTKQSNRLHGLLGKLGLMDEKASLVLEYTMDRTSKSSEMNQHECQHLIQFLESNAPKSATYVKLDKMRKKIIAICYDLKWTKDSGGIDMIRINNFCITRGHKKVELNQYKLDELPKLIHQFERVRKSKNQ